MLPIMVKAVGYMKPTIDPQLRLYVPFNESVGRVAKDYSQYCNHAALTDVLWGIGINGNAGIFNGSTSFGNCGNDASFNSITDSVTVEVLVKVPSAGLVGHRMIVARDYTDVRAFYFELNSGYLDLNHGGSSPTAGNTQLSQDKWSYVAYTYDGSNINYFLNGLSDGSPAFTTDLGVSTREVDIGRREWTDSGLYFIGTINEVLILAKAQPSQQILADTYEVIAA